MASRGSFNYTAHLYCNRVDNLICLENLHPILAGTRRGTRTNKSSRQIGFFCWIWAMVQNVYRTPSFIHLNFRAPTRHTTPSNSMPNSSQQSTFVRSFPSSLCFSTVSRWIATASASSHASLIMFRRRLAAAPARQLAVSSRDTSRLVSRNEALFYRKPNWGCIVLSLPMFCSVIWRYKYMSS